jgi:hypothetical protein|tara:strand:+ start:1785 stop:2066 length:282 start_codon:yes stop_codon:yes gene_type:complete
MDEELTYHGHTADADPEENIYGDPVCDFPDTESLSDMETSRVGDVEAIVDFTQTLLTLDVWTVLSFSVPLTILGVYGLSLYAGFKWIQRYFNK